jgi:hypothetical protein
MWVKPPSTSLKYDDSFWSLSNIIVYKDGFQSGLAFPFHTGQQAFPKLRRTAENITDNESDAEVPLGNNFSLSMSRVAEDLVHGVET